MRILPSLFVALLFATFGCGSSVESDAKKLADLQCQVQKLAAKASTGDMSVISESSKLIGEAAKLRTELEEKYTTAEDKEAFAKAYLRALEDCK